MEENVQTDCLLVENKNLFCFIHIMSSPAWPKRCPMRLSRLKMNPFEELVTLGAKKLDVLNFRRTEDYQMCYIAPGLLVKLSKEKLNTLTLNKKF